MCWEWDVLALRDIIFRADPACVNYKLIWSRGGRTAATWFDLLPWRLWVWSPVTTGFLCCVSMRSLSLCAPSTGALVSPTINSIKFRRIPGASAQTTVRFTFRVVCWIYKKVHWEVQQSSVTHAVFGLSFLSQVSGDVRTGVQRPPDLPVYQHTPPPSPSAWMGICLMFPSPLSLGSLALQTVSGSRNLPARL